jgi:hypothetical protein
MNRQTVWVVCSAVVTVAILLKDSSVPAAGLIGFYIIIGVPLFLHWLTEKREVKP